MPFWTCVSGAHHRKRQEVVVRGKSKICQRNLFSTGWGSRGAKSKSAGIACARVWECVCVGGRRSLTAVSSSQTAPPGLVFRVPAEAATASVDATIADFMMLEKKCGVRTVHYHFQILSYPSQQKTGVSILWRSIVLETA